MKTGMFPYQIIFGPQGIHTVSPQTRARHGIFVVIQKRRASFVLFRRRDHKHSGQTACGVKPHTEHKNTH